jgi:hypothetical protein
MRGNKTFDEFWAFLEIHEDLQQISGRLARQDPRMVSYLSMSLFDGEHSSSENGGWTSKRNTGRNGDAWPINHDGNLVAILRHERDIIRGVYLYLAGSWFERGSWVITMYTNGQRYGWLEDRVKLSIKCYLWWEFELQGWWLGCWGWRWNPILYRAFGITCSDVKLASGRWR